LCEMRPALPRLNVPPLTWPPEDLDKSPLFGYRRVDGALQPAEPYLAA